MSSSARSPFQWARIRRLPHEHHLCDQAVRIVEGLLQATKQSGQHMGSIKYMDKERTAAFFARPDIGQLLTHTLTTPVGGHLTEHGRSLVLEARTYFGYAPSTNDHDIIRPLIRAYKKVQR